MAISTTSPFHYEGNWAGYMGVTIDATFQITLSDANDNLHVAITRWDAQARGTTVAGGYGYINVVLLGWMFPATSMRFANPDDQGPETWEKAIGEIATACPTYLSDLIWGVGMSDEANPPAISQTLQGTMSRDFPLTPDDFENGQLRDFQIVNSISRWRDNPNGQSVVEVSDAFSLSLSDLDWPYFPCAVHQGGQFVSCNATGNDFQRFNASWADCTNDVYSETKSHLRYFDGSSWRRTPLIGAQS